VFENRVLRTIFGSKGGKWHRLEKAAYRGTSKLVRFNKYYYGDEIK
jgi:hypothetical protein